MTQTLSQGEPNLVNDPTDISSATSRSLPETLSPPSTPSVTGQTPSTTYPTSFSSQLDDKYHDLQGTNTPLRLPPSPFWPAPRCSRLHSWAFNRLQYRHDFQNDIQKYNIRIFTQHNLTLKFKMTVKLNGLVYHSLPVSRSNITAQFLPHHSSKQKLPTKTIDTQKIK